MSSAWRSVRRSKRGCGASTITGRAPSSVRHTKTACPLLGIAGWLSAAGSAGAWPLIDHGWKWRHCPHPSYPVKAYKWPTLFRIHAEHHGPLTPQHAAVDGHTPFGFHIRNFPCPAVFPAELYPPPPHHPPAASTGTTEERSSGNDATSSDQSAPGPREGNPGKSGRTPDNGRKP